MRLEQHLGPKYPIQLLAVNANPKFTPVSDVRAWSIKHRMLRRWLYLTGPVRELRPVWMLCGIEAKIVNGDADHTALVFLIDATGKLRTAFPIAAPGSIDTEVGAMAQAIKTMAPSGA
jgi:cytochrome oxidase Cu insertion factor (SCO1/SenC/PrrC family)